MTTKRTGGPPRDLLLTLGIIFFGVLAMTVYLCFEGLVALYEDIVRLFRL